MIMEAFLDPKTQLLVALGAAVAAKCQNCFATLYSAADKVGATDKEIQAAVAIAAKSPQNRTTSWPPSSNRRQREW
jgi:AhpD family alkylhydroperoxidase